MTRYAARKDTNHGEIEAVFRRMLADHVTNTSALGLGVGDLFVSFGRCPGYFIEIKRDAKAKYTAHQERFNRIHPYAMLRCNTIEDAVRICGNIRQLAAGMHNLRWPG